MTKTEKLSHYAVVVIALTAVAISIWQGQLSKKQLEISIRHNKLTVKPYLDIERFTDSDKGILEIRLSNQGYGPAIVKSWELWNDGKKYSRCREFKGKSINRLHAGVNVSNHEV